VPAVSRKIEGNRLSIFLRRTEPIKRDQILHVSPMPWSDAAEQDRRRPTADASRQMGRPIAELAARSCGDASSRHSPSRGHRQVGHRPTLSYPRYRLKSPRAVAAGNGERPSQVSQDPRQQNALPTRLFEQALLAARRRRGERGHSSYRVVGFRVAPASSRSSGDPDTAGRADHSSAERSRALG
jgi:hypothetical protein